MEIEKLNNCVTDLEGEVWKVINHPSIGDYSNRYMVSNKGRVKSLNYLGRTGKERILKQNKRQDAYLQIVLCNGKPKIFLVHRLVALMFLSSPNPDNPLEVNNLQINHRDENPSNNCVENLEWCNSVYNNRYGSKTQRMLQTRENSDAWKEGIERMKETRKTSTACKEAIVKLNAKKRKQVFQYNLNLELVNVYESATFAARVLGFLQSAICACCNAKRKTAYNFIWSYEPLKCFQLTLFPTITKVS